MTKLALAAVVGFLVYVVVGILFYQVIMGDPFAAWQAAVARAEPIVSSGLLGIALLMLTMAAVFPHVRGREVPWMDGARLGLVVGVIAAGIFLANYAVYELVLVTVVGGVIGLVCGETAVA